MAIITAIVRAPSNMRIVQAGQAATVQKAATPTAIVQAEP